MNKISTTINYLFSSVALVFLSFLIFSELRISSALKIIATIFVFLFYSVIFFHFDKKRMKKMRAGKNEREKRLNVKSFLFLHDEKEVLPFFLSLTGYNHSSCPFYDDGHVVVTTFFEKEIFDEFDLFAIYKRHKNRKITIYCFDKSEKVGQIAKQLNVTVLSFDDYYEYVKNEIPENEISLKEQKERIKISSFFSKKNSVSFIMFGLFLLVFSLISPYKIYYLIIGGAYILLGASIPIFIK